MPKRTPKKSATKPVSRREFVAGVVSASGAIVLPSCGAEPPADAGSVDGGGPAADGGHPSDGGRLDSGTGQDGGSAADAGRPDAGSSDGGSSDSGTSDGGIRDGGTADGGGSGQDGGRGDAGIEPPDVNWQGNGPRVLRLHNRRATDWLFQANTSRYWEHVDPSVCRTMVDTGIMLLTGASSPAAAWDSIFHQNQGGGYVDGQRVAIKINWNDCDSGLGDGPTGNWLVSNHQLIQGLVESLLTHVRSLRAGNLLVGDPSRNPYPRLRTAFAALGVTLIEFGSNVFPISQQGLVDYADRQDDFVCNSMFGVATHLIDVPLLKAIEPNWGISGALKDAQGKVGLSNLLYAQQRQSCWISKHAAFSRSNLSNPLVTMNQHPWIRNKRRLVVADGLFGLYDGQHFPGGDDIPRPWRLFQNDATNSLLFAFDPVAIDCVMHDLVRFERIAQGRTGTFAKPVQQACAMAGLGVHDDPIETTVAASPSGPRFSYQRIDYQMASIA